ncbi:hypothetical protein T484DRAFT_1951731 [Baffinella frigidus]|nr:hypothetical protein T484DRAFT_1951731 [Cryptophyta sp. CCMP2293]
MFRKLAITALLLGATCVEAFAPGAPMARLPAMRSATCRNSKLALRMQGDNEEYRPIIPTTENPMAPDYAREPTQFERQGLVESNVNTAPGVMMGEGGLTRREALGAGGAVGIGSIALLWAVTRNSGYDQKDTSRDAGVAVVNTEAVATKEIQASIAGLKGNLAKLIEIQAAFLADPNAQLTPSVKGFSVVDIRTELNKITFAAFDEDTQIKTDRVTRNIIQDIVELENACRLKEGATRSPKRVAAVDKWLKQSTGDFSKFLAYFP